MDLEPVEALGFERKKTVPEACLTRAEAEEQGLDFEQVAWAEAVEHLVYEGVEVEAELILAAAEERQLGRSLHGHMPLLIWDQAWTVLDPYIQFIVTCFFVKFILRILKELLKIAQNSFALFFKSRI